MYPRTLQVLVNTMIWAGVLLVPTAMPHAVQDLIDLKTIIDSAATTINAAPNNSTWGFLNPASPTGPLGTADLLSNITTSVLRATYLLNIDKTAWLATPNNTNSSNPATPSTSTTLALPSTSAAPSNTSVDAPYMDYINSIATLSTALTTLGRSWHKEMNRPVSDAIGGLQQTISTFSSNMISADLIHGQSVLRTIRASGNLEDAQQAWSRNLNLPGGAAKPAKRWVEVEVKTGEVHEKGDTELTKRRLSMGTFFTHKDLWGRAPAAEAGARQRRNV